MAKYYGIYFREGSERAGGAPFNVAYHLSRMGVDAHMISSVGSDYLGSELLEKSKTGTFLLTESR